MVLQARQLASVKPSGAKHCRFWLAAAEQQLSAVREGNFVSKMEGGGELQKGSERVH